jgi:hypothetical protein
MVAHPDDRYFVVTGYFIGIRWRYGTISIHLFLILMDRKKNLETILVLVLAFVVLYKLRKHEYLLLVAISIGVIGLLLPWAAEKIHWAWMKLAEGLGFVMSKVLLTFIYYIILMPLSVFAKMRRNIQARQQEKEGSYFVTRNFLYTKESMENMW